LLAADAREWPDGRLGAFVVTQPAVLSALSAGPVTAPEQIMTSDDRNYLRLILARGNDIELKADRLRAACKCAHCTRVRMDNAFPDRFDGITIEQFSLIGGYAINVTFSDGHARGIYPWAYLIGLGDAKT
jgi:DUF971 family protein